MYSLVLLTALSAGADVTPAAVPAATPVVVGCCGGCTGCCGYSVTYGSCYGSCTGSCHGSCHGGLFSGARLGGLFSKHHSCHGCCGGSSCHGCCGGSSTCCGGGCTGSSWGPAVTYPPYTLHGYNEGYAPYYYPSVTNSNPPTTTTPATIPTSPTTPDVPKSMPEKKPGSDDTKKTGMSASIKLRLPADSKLYIDGQPIAVAGTERLFSTPQLAPGQKFFYDAKAELMVNGTRVIEEKRLIVEAGSTLNESFEKLFAALPSKATVASEK